MNAYVRDLNYYAADTAEKKVSSIFFGGGTPSLMTEEMISFIIETIHSLWTVNEDVEISLEANPSSVNRQKMNALRKTGVNRLSVGVQALRNKDLELLGRLHTVEQALDVLNTAKEIFPFLSADFIYARPCQTADEWKAELNQILELDLKHLSLYQLTVEKGTLFYKKGIFPVQEELGADLFELTYDMTRQAGLKRYEVSNHAVEGYQCRHNMLYWQSGEWIGIGPAAHGRFIKDGTFYATSHESSVYHWLKSLNNNKLVLTQKEKAEEMIIMALRTDEGIDRNAFFQITGKAPEDFMNMNTLQEYQSENYLICDGYGIRASSKGIMILDALCSTLLY